MEDQNQQDGDAAQPIERGPVIQPSRSIRFALSKAVLQVPDGLGGGEDGSGPHAAGWYRASVTDVGSPRGTASPLRRLPCAS